VKICDFFRIDVACYGLGDMSRHARPMSITTLQDGRKPREIKPDLLLPDLEIKKFSPANQREQGRV